MYHYSQSCKSVIMIMFNYKASLNYVSKLTLRLRYNNQLWSMSLYGFWMNPDVDSSTGGCNCTLSDVGSHRPKYKCFHYSFGWCVMLKGIFPIWKWPQLFDKQGTLTSWWIQRLCPQLGWRIMFSIVDENEVSYTVVRMPRMMICNRFPGHCY